MKHQPDTYTTTQMGVELAHAIFKDTKIIKRRTQTFQVLGIRHRLK